MTVKELIERLQNCPQDYDVAYSEGEIVDVVDVIDDEAIVELL